MNIAVTGGLGFFGKYIVEELLQREFDVTVISTTGKSIPDHWGNRVCVQFIDSTESDPESPLDHEKGVDTLIYLPWGNLDNYFSLDHIETELFRHYQLLAKVARMGIKRIIVTGTCFEYGMAEGPLSEERNPEPSNPYGLAKNCLHQMLLSLNREVRFELIWTRLFYIYGEGSSRRSLFDQFISAVRRKDATFPMSRGDQIRDFIPVKDAARIIAHLAVTPGTPKSPLNICSGRPTSVRSQVEKWRSALNSDIKLSLGEFPVPEYEPYAFWGDATRLNQFLEDFPIPQNVNDEDYDRL